VRVAVLCSGQGFQGADMFDLLANAPQAAHVFEVAKTVLGGQDPRDLVHRASNETLHENKIAQVLCCTAALTAWAALGNDVRVELVVAGYSVGELAAWGVAGLLGARTVLDLAARRATAMDEATTQPSGLIAVRGLWLNRLQPICERRGAYVAIINAPDQFLVAGTLSAIDSVAADARLLGAHTTSLPVGVPAHSPLLAAAADRFETDLKTLTLPSEIPSSVRLLSGIDGSTVFVAHAGIEKLARQIRQTVNWAACMASCREAGVTKAIELGPGSALANMMRSFMPDCDAHSVAEFKSLAGVAHWMETSKS
jgi:[acyl-carrier-protein] S-malonyltransferase